MLISDIDRRITSLIEESDHLFDIKELQNHKVRTLTCLQVRLFMYLNQYDLRAVLMHNGLYGRKNIYCYVKDRGAWWKTVDSTVTEVSLTFCISVFEDN